MAKKPPTLKEIDWSKETGHLIKLDDYRAAPDNAGYYEIGFCPTGTMKSFDTQYCGITLDRSLRIRLREHFKDSSNKGIANHLKKGNNPVLWCRYKNMNKKTFDINMILAYEGLFTTAEIYSWNDRREFTQIAAIYGKYHVT